MARLGTKRLTKLHQDFLQEFDQIYDVQKDERRQSMEDRRFYSIAGAQWEDAIGEQFANVPRIEANKIHASVIRIFSEYRNNRITVDFRPKDSETSSETAETLTGRYRADEQESTAQEAYDNAFEEGVGGGIGAWRLRVVYADDEDADDYSGDGDPDDDPKPLRASIEPIVDADSSVWWNLDAKRQDKADAEKCFVLTAYTRSSYEKGKYAKFSVSSWPTAKPDGNIFDWCLPDVVYLAEIYVVEKINDVVHVYHSPVTGEEKELTDDDIEDADMMKDLIDIGYSWIRDQKVKRRKVHKYIANGIEIIEDCGYIAGKCIPIVPYYGKRWYVDGIERSMGHVRLGKDMQRLLNMMLSRLAEIASFTPYEVPILTPQQVRGHVDSWASGNIKRGAYRLVNETKDGQGNPVPIQIQYLKPPDVPPALAALTTAVVSTLSELQGDNPDQDQMVSNISAKAVELIQTHIDMKSFIYTDNMAKAMRRSGQIWLSIIKDITPEGEHEAMTLGADGKTQSPVMMNSTTIDKTTGATVPVNNPNEGRFGVWADIGPSFQNRKDATVRALLNILGVTNPQDQTLATVLISTAIMNMDGEGLDDIRDYLRKKLVGMGAVKPTPEEEQEAAAEAQNQPPDANTVFLLAEATKSKAQGHEALASALQKLAQAGQARAAGLNQLAQARKAIGDTHGAAIDSILKVIGMQNDQAVAEQAAGTITEPAAAPA